MEPRTDRILLPKHLYYAFLQHQVSRNPSWRIVKRNQSRAMPYELVDGLNQTLLTYNRWFNIMNVFFAHARVRVIDGYRLDMFGMGYIHGKWIERNYRNKRINWKATVAEGTVYDEEKGKNVFKKKVYFTEPDYCRIGWSNRRNNLTSYKFSPTNSSHSKKGFKEQFSDAHKANPNLKLSYLYYPY